MSRDPTDPILGAGDASDLLDPNKSYIVFSDPEEMSDLWDVGDVEGEWSVVVARDVEDLVKVLLMACRLSVLFSRAVEYIETQSLHTIVNIKTADTTMISTHNTVLTNVSLHLSEC